MDLIISGDRSRENICIWQKMYRLYNHLQLISRKKNEKPNIKLAENINTQSIDRKPKCLIYK